MNKTATAANSKNKAPKSAAKATAKSVAVNGRMDSLRWWSASLLFIFSVLAYYYFADIATAWRLLALTLIGLGCVAAVYTTERGSNLRRLAHDARLEIAKVVWPGRQEVMQATAIILLVVLLLVLILWGLDSLFAWMIASVLGH